jgi:hypothetical protein
VIEEARMNWGALAAIAEIIAAVAVVVTLLYLSREVRHNSRSVEIAALRDTTAQWSHWSNMIATSPDLAEIVCKGNISYQALSEPEKLRYGAYVQSFFDNAESVRSLIVQHEADKNLDVLESIVARRLVLQGFDDWWAENTDDYEQGFIDWVGRLRQDRGSVS